MKQFKLLLLFLVIGFVAESQVNYLPNRSRNIWIAGKFDSTLHIPSGTTTSLRTGGYDYRGAVFYRTSDSTVYVYTGTQWISVKGAGGSSDSTIFATLYRVDTAKTNIRTTLDTKIDSMRRVGLNVQAYKNGTWITQFTDSVGTGGGVSDTSVFIIDTLYNRLAHVINTDSLRLKSLQMQVNGSTVTPIETDSTLSYNIIDNSIDTTIYNSDGVISSDRAINGDSKSISFNTFRKFYAETDSLQIYLNSGYINISGINDGGTLSDSILVVSVDGDVKKMSSDRVGTPTMQQVLDAEGGNAILTGNPDFGPDEDLSAELSFGDTYLWNRISMYSGSYRFLANDLNHQTDIIIHADSIALNPSNGYMNIDSLRQGTSNDSVLVWNKQTGIVGYRNASAFGGGGSPAGNFNNIQINRNGAFASPASDSLNFSSSSLQVKGEMTMNGAAPVLNFGTAAGNPEIAATASALIFRRNDLGAYTDVTLGAINMNSYSSVGNGSIGGKLSVTTGTNKSAGTGTLASGTATISTTQVTANSLIFIQYTSCSSCASTYISAKTAGTSFVVTSTNGSDASTFNWWIIN